jgi:ligand-binding sensor domain-containing protein
MNVLKPLLAAFAFLFVLVNQGNAQLPSKIIFNRLTKKEGLASNSIFQTLQDRQGFLWIATENGLQRYDGHHFLSFHYIPGDTLSIPDDRINKLHIDNRNRLWVISGKQVGIFNTSNFTYKAVTVSKPINAIKKLWEDEKGNLVLVSDLSVLLQFDEKLNSFSKPYDIPALPEGYRFDNIVLDANPSRYWLTSRQGILLFDTKTKKYSYGAQNTNNDAIINAAKEIKNTRYPFVDMDGSLWFVDWIPFRSVPVLYYYNRKNGEMKSFNNGEQKFTDIYHEIWSIREQSNGIKWIFGSGLLAWYNAAESRFVNIKSQPFSENDIQFDYVVDVFEDREKNVWISTNKGLYNFNTGRQFLTGVMHRRIADTAGADLPASSILQTQRNGIWVSTFGGGVYSYDAKLNPLPNPFTERDPVNKTLAVQTMTQRKNGEIWLGLHSGEIKIYNPSDNSIHSLFTTMMEGKAVRHIIEDRSGNIWWGNYNGDLVKCEKGNWRDSSNAIKVIDSGLSVVIKLYEDPKGFIWVCTTLDGIYKRDAATGKTIQHYGMTTTGKNNGLSKEGATDIVQYNDSLYLIASNNLSILNTRTNTFRYLSAADGLPAENIVSMVVDKEKRVWVAVTGGLYRLNPDKKLVVSYTAAHGLEHNNFEVASSAVLNDGRIAFGTAHNFLIFDPEKGVDKTAVPRVVISGVHYAGGYLSMDSLQSQGRISLPYDKSSLAVDFSALSYSNQYTFQYMLEGLDEEWKTTRETQVEYPYLPPGDYTFKVKAVNSEGVESRLPGELQVHVRTPFWRAWWFYTLVVLLLIGLLHWLDRRRQKRKEFIHEMRSNIAGSLHQEVNTALSNINILSEVARMKADYDIQKSKEYIQQIHSKSQHMIVAMNDMLWSIDPANDNMQQTVDRMREYVEGLNSQEGTKICLHVDETVRSVNLNMQSRYQALYLFKESINALVDASAKQCDVNLTIEKDFLTYTIEFENEGVDRKAIDSFVNGAEIGKRVTAINGVLETDFNKSNSLLILKVPLQ